VGAGLPTQPLIRLMGQRAGGKVLWAVCRRVNRSQTHEGLGDGGIRNGTPASKRNKMYGKSDRGDAPIPPLTRAKARLARTAMPTSSFSVPVPA
jgi:hypothetical protein